VQRAALSLVFLSCLTFFLGLGRQAITDSDEAFYAEAAREMGESGDWITPHFNYADRWQKPVLYYWLTAATNLVAGPTEWAARFWSAMSGLGLVLLTWVAARSVLVSPKPRSGDGLVSLKPRSGEGGWLAGAIVATCYGYFAMARLALPDLPLAFCVTLCIWSALEKRWALAGLGAALGFLMKGPVALALPVIVLVPIWWRERQLGSLRLRDIGVAALIFVVVGVPWYAAMTAIHGSPYLESFFVADNFERFATDRFNDPRPFWFYVPIVIGGMLPWGIFLAVLPWRSVVAIFRRQRTVTHAEWRLLLWAIVPLLFFTVSIGKQPRYVLPVLPPLAILLAQAITVRLKPEPTDEGKRQPALAVATWTTALFYVVLAVLLWRARTIFITAYPALTTAAILAMSGSAAALVWVAAAARWRILPHVMAACATVLLLSVQFGALAGVRPEPVEQMAALVSRHRAANEPVGEYQVFVRNLVFYTRFPQTELYDEGRALDFINSAGRVLLVIRATDLSRLEAVAGRTLHRLGEVTYLNTANIKFRTLVFPLPQQDLERVLLVSNK
jgi:4-amino-4-deoxy-L-arabinose transferase-like glycosyltransferase